MKTFCLTKASFSCNIIFVFWGYSSAGRALEWHSRGQRFDPAYLHHCKFWPRFCVAFGFSHAFSQTNYSTSIPLISTTRKPALELRSGAFSFSSCKYRTPSATSHCRGCLHKVSICKAKPITVLLAHAKQQPCQCAPRAGPHRCDQSDHKQQFAYRWGAANPARG